jgi:hypothetical protein
VVLGTALLGPMVVGYELGCGHASRMRVAAAYRCCRGRSERELRELGARTDVSLEPRRSNAFAGTRRGDTVVVSASLRPYLEGLRGCGGLGGAQGLWEGRPGPQGGTRAGGEDPMFAAVAGWH